VRFRVEWSTRAQADIDRLFDFLLERELERDGGDLDLPGRAITAIRNGVSLLERHPFTCRKADDEGVARELVVEFGATGYVILFVVTDDQVAVGAVRHQREADYRA
jgi:plasmid stabilization system protein ParE